MTTNLQELSTIYLPALDQVMRNVLGAGTLEADGQTDDPFYGMIHYHMGWVDDAFNVRESNPGKRIRPQLCLLSCSAAGGDWEQALGAAASLEILHNFSLVHDDIEDQSPTRRGRPTVWTLWGEPLAINTGDAMFAMAHLSLNRLIEHGVDPAIVVQALRRFDETSVQLTQGQHADMDFEAREEVSVDEYLAMIRGKTAVLLGLSAELGALVAGADPTTVAHYRAFGLNLGLAFQIQDDILGIWGDESITGKSAATDIITRKKTLPVLYGLDRSRSLSQLYQSDNNNPTFVTEVVKMLDKSGARPYAQGQAVAYSEKARYHLTQTQPTGMAKEALLQLTDSLLQRNS